MNWGALDIVPRRSRTAITRGEGNKVATSTVSHFRLNLSMSVPSVAAAPSAPQRLTRPFQLVLGLMAIGSLMMSSLCPPIGASMSECDGRLYVRTIGDCAFSSGSSRNGQPSIIPLGPSL
jgi:hypothetical protein